MSACLRSPALRPLPARACRTWGLALTLACLPFTFPAPAQAAPDAGPTRAATADSAAHPASGALPPPRSIEFAGDRVVLPMQLVEGRPVVEVRIGGKGPYRLGIETGAAFAALTRATLDSLQLKSNHSDEVGEIYTLPSVEMGECVVRGLEVRDAAPVDRSIDGFLGLGVFPSLLLTIDYPGSRLVLERGTLPAPDGQSVFATTRVGPFFAVALDVAGRRLPAVIDTRGSSAFGFTPAVGESLRFVAPPVLVGQARGAAIPLTDVKLGRLDGDVTLGTIRFERPLVTLRALPPGYPDGLIGGATLGHFAMTLDQRSGRVRFVPRDGTTIPAPPPVTDLGMRLRQRPGQPPEVGEVRAGTPAESSGVREGDRILEAAGIAGADLDATRWRALANAGKPVSMKLKRGEATLDRVVAPATLVP